MRNDDRSSNGFSSRPMVQGNWTCTSCGAEITELPFEPAPGRDIFCKACYKSGSGSTRRDNGPRPPREMVQGNWQCSECGTGISELPFEPADGKPIFCQECWKAKRPQKF